MGTRVNHFFRKFEVDLSASPVALTDAYGNVVAIPLVDEQGRAITFRGRVETLTFRIENASGQTNAFARITADDQGDIVLLPDTEAELSPGVLTSDTGTGVIAYGVPLVCAPTLTELTAFVRLETGITGDLTYLALTWSE